MLSQFRSFLYGKSSSLSHFTN